MAALLFYAGALYTHAYYDHFRVRVFSLGLGFSEFVFNSAWLITLPVFLALAALVLLPQLPGALAFLGVPSRLVESAGRFGRAVARRHALVVLAAVCLMALWPYLGAFNWVPPLLVVAGLLLGQTSAARSAGRAGRPGSSYAVATVFLVWAVALAAGHQGRSDAREAERRLVNRTAAVLLSTERLSIVGPGLVAEDLGPAVRYRYRYTGLRVLTVRESRYYLLPLGWRHADGPTYVIDDDDSIRIELRPGTRP
ncbi:hypothetical protein [Streptomyces sp. NPDC127098]|uniref:hypothetical protein n=1 Tax=Streptomyces sp. NPDC127098 TaxID=3347137 RepID=UPI0036571866